MPVVVLKNVTKRYQETGVEAIKSVSLSVEQGEILTLLGPSGCGKTTLLRLIAGFERPDNGTVTVENKMVASPTKWIAPENRGVSMVFQDYALFPHLNVEKNVAFGLWRLSQDSRDELVKEALELVGLDKYRKHFPHELSGGQQQRVALARALAGKPKVILLDEPLSNLDADLRNHMRKELKQILQHAGATAILVTHDQEDSFALATKVAILKQGRIEQIGAAETVYHEPKTRFIANFLGIADFLPSKVDKDKIVTPVATFTNNLGLKADNDVEVLIRPDDVELVNNKNGNGIITERQFKGAQILYTVETAGLELHSLGDSYGGMSVGTKVDLKVAVDHMVVFDVKKKSKEKV